MTILSWVAFFVFVSLCSCAKEGCTKVAATPDGAKVVMPCTDDLPDDAATSFGETLDGEDYGWF